MKETTEHLLSEFKLATGKGQLIRANEMAARLFARLIEADQKAAASACDPTQCPCRTAKANKTAALESLVTYPVTTAAAPQVPTSTTVTVATVNASYDLTVAVPGDLNVTADDVEIKAEETPAPTPRKKK